METSKLIQVELKHSENPGFVLFFENFKFVFKVNQSYYFILKDNMYSLIQETPLNSYGNFTFVLSLTDKQMKEYFVFL